MLYNGPKTWHQEAWLQNTAENETIFFRFSKKELLNISWLYFIQENRLTSSLIFYFIE
jgi:hypothetical protein